RSDPVARDHGDATHAPNPTTATISGSRMMMRIAPRTSNENPDRVIVVIGTAPEPETTACCGVAAGSTDPTDAAHVAASAGTNGLTPAATATGMTIGATTAADAVLLVVSDTRIASRAAKTVIATTLVSPSAFDTPLPIVSASPVDDSRPPKMMPVPNSTIVPQSISAASRHRSVNSRLGQSTGSRYSSDAPKTATMPSSSRSDTAP